MEGSMNLKKRAVEGIVVAGSLVMMSSIAQAADVAGTQPMTAAAVTRTDLATNGTAGIVAELNQFEMSALEGIDQTAGVEQMNRVLVAAAEATSVDGTEPGVAGQPTAGTEVQPTDKTAITTQLTGGVTTDVAVLSGGTADVDSALAIDGAPAGVTAQLTDSLQEGATGQPTDGTSTDGTIADVETQPTDGAIADMATQPTDGTITDAATQPTDGTITDAETQPTDGTIADAETQPTGGTITDAETQPTDGTTTDTGGRCN